MEKHVRNIALIRASMAAVLVAAIGFPVLFQPALDTLWSAVRVNPLFRASFFETLWTTGCYIALEVGYIDLMYWLSHGHESLSELQHFYTKIVIDPGSSHIRLDPRSGKEHLYRNGTVKIVPWAKRLPELFAYTAPLFLLDLTMIKKYAGVPTDALLRSGGYSAASVAKARDSLTGIIIRPTYLVPSLHNVSWSSPLQMHRALPFAPPTSARIALDLIAAIFIYDFLFFIPHVLLHRVPVLYTCFHETHHRHSEIQPQVTNRLDITERMLLLLA